MKIIRYIIVATFVLTFGCGKITPDTESDLTKLRYGLSNYLDFLESEDLQTSTMVNQFYLIFEYWTEIQDKHKLPRRFENRMNNSMCYYKLFLIANERFDDRNPERSYEEEKTNTQYWEGESKVVYEQIDSGYWKFLKQRHIERNGTEEEIEYIDLMSKEMIYRGHIGIMDMIGSSGSALQIMFDELANTLDK